MKGLIYIIKNATNDKIYIGQTTQTLIGRWDDHRSKSRTYPNKLYIAMREIGLQNFYIEEIESNIDKEELNNREGYWINYYNSIETGYNMIMPCDVVNRRPVYKINPISNEVIEKYDSVSAAASDNHLDNSGISKVCLRKGKSLGGFKWCYCDNYDLEYLSSIKAQPRFKSVYQLDLKGNIIKEWISISEIVDSLGYKQSCISECCNGNNKTGYGYNWCFAENYEQYTPTVSTQRIYQFDKDDNIIKLWDSANDIITFLQKGTASNIRKCCKGKQKTAYGYKWKYEKDVTNSETISFS